MYWDSTKNVMCLNCINGWVGSSDFNMSQNKRVLIWPLGGGVKANWDSVLKYAIFFHWSRPLLANMSEEIGPKGKMFKCDLCSKTLKNRRNLLSHLESKHFLGMFSHKCKHCGKKYNCRNSLEYHCRICPNRLIWCSIKRNVVDKRIRISPEFANLCSMNKMIHTGSSIITDRN